MGKLELKGSYLQICYVLPNLTVLQLTPAGAGSKLILADQTDTNKSIHITQKTKTRTRTSQL